MIKKAQETKKDTAEQHVSCRETTIEIKAQGRESKERKPRQGEDKNQVFYFHSVFVHKKGQKHCENRNPEINYIKKQKATNRTQRPYLQEKIN